MEEDKKLLNEVVVTALGIKREAKALTYNVQDLKGSEVTRVRDANFVNALAGKIAGVTINQKRFGRGWIVKSGDARYQIAIRREQCLICS